MSGFTTRAIHTPFLKKDIHGSLHMPVYDSVSFEFETAEETEEAFLGKRPRHMYTRITNPTVEHLEQKIRHVTGSLAVVAVSSGMAAIARKHNILLIADTTVTPLYFFNSKAYGVDIEVFSGTKYLSGGATTVGGILIDNGTYDWAHNPKLEKEAKQFGPFALVTKLKREVYRNLGACLSPHNAYLQSIGLETLALRADRSCHNTRVLAGFLSRHPKVKSVNYPGLGSSPYHETATRIFGQRCGAIATFKLSSRKECFAFLNRLRLLRRATNINDNKTLALHPASTIFCEYSADLKQQMGVPETLIRLSVGIEDVEDLIADITQALED